MHLAWYVQDVLVGGALTMDSHVGFTGHSVLRPCLQSPVTRGILLSGAWPRCQIPRKFFTSVQILLFHPGQNFWQKNPEDMSWKARWIVALERAEAAIKPSVQPYTCPRPVIFTPSILLLWICCEEGQNHKRTDTAVFGSGIYISEALISYIWQWHLANKEKF